MVDYDKLAKITGYDQRQGYTYRKMIEDQKHFMLPHSNGTVTFFGYIDHVDKNGLPIKDKFGVPIRENLYSITIIMTTTVAEKLNSLSNEQLIQLSEELRLPTVPENALIREVIKDTEVETTLPVLAFVGVSQQLVLVLADRLIIEGQKVQRILDRQDRCALDL